MKFKHLAIGTVLLLIAVAGAYAQCSLLLLEGDHLRHVDQYGEIKVKLVAYSNCSNADYKVSVYSDLPVRLGKTSFNLNKSSTAIMATISPGAAEPDLYTVHLLMESDQDITREEFVVKVSKTDNPLLTASAPALMNIPENQPFDVTIAIKNEDEVVLNNIVVFIEEDGQERLYADELESLKAGETKFVNFAYEPRSRGEYTLNYTVTAGEFKFRGQTIIGSSANNYPLSTMATVYPHEGGYRLSYVAKNVGPETMNKLFLTIEDAPSDWTIISPSIFSLRPGQTKEVELIALYGVDTDMTVNLALYENDALRAEDGVVLSQSRLAGTGLISFAESFELGLFLLLIVVALFFGYRIKKGTDEKNIDLRTMIPNWAETLWPF